MACPVQDKTISTVMELLCEQRFEGMRETFEGNRSNPDVIDGLDVRA